MTALVLLDNPMLSFLPSPFDSESPPIDDELVERLFSSHFSRLPCCKLYEGTLLPLDNGDGTNLTKLVKVAPEIRQISKKNLKCWK